MGVKYFTWKDEYSVHSTILDDQHKTLFDIANELFEAFTAGKHKEKIGDIIQKLYDYTVYHFIEEEKIVQQSGGALSPEHLLQHDGFIQKIKEISEKQKKIRGTVTYGLMSFLRKWLTGHIMQVDQGYVPTLTKSGQVQKDKA